MLSAEALDRAGVLDHADLEQFDGLRAHVVSLNWGGKRDYATWFSPEPSAMLGIQLLPMGPVQVSRPRVTRSASGPTSRRRRPDGYDVLFGDYLLMYRALAGAGRRGGGVGGGDEPPGRAIDDGTRAGHARVHRRGAAAPTG